MGGWVAKHGPQLLLTALSLLWPQNNCHQYSLRECFLISSMSSCPWKAGWYGWAFWKKTGRHGEVKWKLAEAAWPLHDRIWVRKRGEEQRQVSWAAPSKLAGPTECSGSEFSATLSYCEECRCLITMNGIYGCSSKHRTTEYIFTSGRVQYNIRVKFPLRRRRKKRVPWNPEPAKSFIWIVSWMNEWYFSVLLSLRGSQEKQDSYFPQRVYKSLWGKVANSHMKWRPTRLCNRSPKNKVTIFCPTS